jgi:hypothetical protein
MIEGTGAADATLMELAFRARECDDRDTDG